VIANPEFVSDESLRSWVGYGLDVLLWVALWTPLSAFLLEWFPLYRRYQAYRALWNMEMSVLSQSGN
jgi:hypothetical protein